MVMGQTITLCLTPKTKVNNDMMVVKASRFLVVKRGSKVFRQVGKGTGGGKLWD